LAKNDKHGLPPGLAKKADGLPPGQAKKVWRRGERLPQPYYVETRYVIVQPQRYRLPPPPFGYRWVDVGGDAYLVQTRTGLITDLVLDLLHR
jgi:Ni/Co efflux regulator RcnB